MAKVLLFEAELKTISIDTEVSYFDDKFLTELPPELIEEYLNCERQRLEIQRKLREYKKY